MSVQTQAKPLSLSFITSTAAAGAVAVGMAAYAVGQYLVDSSQSPVTLLLHHGWHVVALWLLIYGCVMFILHRVLLRPLQEIYVHLYGIGAGRLRPLRLDSRVRELTHIADGVNLMVRRMGIGVDGESRLQVQCVAETLRHLASVHANTDVKLATELTEAAKTLEQSLTDVHCEV